MEASRRDFLKLATIGGTAAAVLGFDVQPARAQLRVLKIARASETRSICPYCAVGCGTIIYTIGDKAKNVTADGAARSLRSLQHGSARRLGMVVASKSAHPVQPRVL